MYPSTTFELIDNSDIGQIQVPAEDNIDRPVYMQVFASSKGPEEWQQAIMGKEVLALYGSTPSFATYGQPLLQTISIATAGGRINTRRICADDAKLANLLVWAEVYRDTAQAVTSAGNLLYYDVSGNTTINVSDANDETTGVPYYGSPQSVDPTTGDGTGPDCVMETKAKVVFHVENYNGNQKAVMKQWKSRIMSDSSFAANAPIGTVGTIENDTVTDTAASVGAVYPLFFISDNGRGVSNKSIKIYVDETARKPVDYTRYILEVYEGNKRLEQMAFTFNPDQIEQNSNMAIDHVVSRSSKQIRCALFEESLKKFVMQVSDITSIPYEELIMDDLIYGTDTYGKELSKYKFEMADSVAFNDPLGIKLLGGDNGSFGDAPMSSPEYEVKLEEAFTEIGGDIIYDLDNFRVDVIFDANYPPRVKRAIEEFVNFRDDVFYFRDLGTSANTLAEIQVLDLDNVASRACATYENYWDIVDPYTKKRITVTATYNLAILFVSHYMNGQSRPFCGIRYGITFPDVLDGSINFTPKHTPSVNQKAIIDDARINYANYYQGTLTMDTEYTSQTRNTQLSFINNVLAIQNLIKKIRYRCPKIRYAFFTSGIGDNGNNSLEKYISDVNDVITENALDFATISLSYEENNIYENNKIFYACIDVKMKDFIHSEKFKLTVLKS